MIHPIPDILRQGGGICLLLAAGCFPAMGEQPDSLYSDLGELEVVTTRVKEDVISTSPLFRLDEEKMRSMGVTDLTDALHRMPGLNIRDYGGAGGMKTVSARGLGSNHTGVIYDGVALSDARSGQIDLGRYSLDNVDDLTLIVGDNNDIFTSARASASAATVVVNTGSVPATADSIWHFSGQLRVGSFGLVNPYIKVGKALNRRFSFSAVGEYTYGKNDYPYTLRNGIQVTREKRQNSRMSSGHGELNFSWMPASFRILNGKVYYYDNDRQLPGPVVLYNPTADDTLHDRNFFGQLTYTDASVDKWKFRVTSKFNWDATFYHEVDGKYSAGFQNESYIQREMYVAGAALFNPIKSLSVSYAIDYFYNNLTSNDPTTVGPSRNSLLQALSVNFKCERVQLTGRLLYSIYLNDVKAGESAADRRKMSPSLSVAVQPFSGRLFFLRASYKNIFRMPTFNESYYYRLGSIALKPETTDQWNLGATWQRGKTGPLTMLAVTGDVFYNRVHDKIVGIPMNMFVWTMMNLEKVRAIGADLTLDATFSLARRQTLVLTGSYSWQRVQPRTAKSDPDYNKQVAYTPVHSGAASLTWQNPWVDIVAKLTGCGERYGTNSNLPVSRVKGYVETGVSLMRELTVRTHKVNLRLDVLNIFDCQYEIVASYPMPGRSFRLTAGFSL